MDKIDILKSQARSMRVSMYTDNPSSTWDDIHEVELEIVRLERQQAMDDLNNQVFNRIEPKALARAVWLDLKSIEEEGLEIPVLYEYVKEAIERNR